MGVISEGFMKFKSSSYLISRIKRRLRTYDIAGLIDENSFYEHIDMILNIMGLGVFSEEEAILKVKDGKACLPDNFKEIYAAYKCTPEKRNTSQRHLQNVSVFEYDITTEVYSKRNGCEIECDCGDRLMERLVLKQFVNDRYITESFVNPILLTLSPNVKAKCTMDCLNTIATSHYEITIDDGYIYTNFDDGDAIYLKYYAFPLDEEGFPMIPDVPEIEKAIENYIMWQIFMDFWISGDVPEAVQKMQYLQSEYEESLGDARYILKLPRFTKLVNVIKNKKGINMVKYFSQLERNK